jgi:hypothetical protein
MALKVPVEEPSTASIADIVARGGLQVGDERPAAVLGIDHRTSSSSDGCHALVKNGSSGLYSRKIVNHPLPGVV